MPVNPDAPRTSRTLRLAPPKRDRRAFARMALPEPGATSLPYPSRLLEYPSALMFLLMREMFRLSQSGIAGSSEAERMRFPHFMILLCLEEFGTSSQREVADRLRLDPSDLVGFVDRLERAGYVERRRDDRDRRRYALEVTAAGRRAVRERARVAERMNAELLSELTPQDRNRLRDLLRRAVRRLDVSAANEPRRRT